MLKYIHKGNLIAGLWVGFFTFFIALLVSLGSQALMDLVNNVLLAIIMLLLIIALGIGFDIVGTAAAAATLPPFNAKAAKKVYGAYQAVKITRNASVVANYSCDVVGDVCGTVSGAIGAGIVASLINMYSLTNIILFGSMMTALIAALTVGGKAMGKKVAIDHAEQIIFKAGMVAAWWEGLTGIEIFKSRR